MADKENEQIPDGEIPDEDGAAFDRRFKYGLIGFAVVEFFVLAAIVCWKVSR